MAYCKNCGTKLDDGAKFCPKCGTPTDKTPSIENVADGEPNPIKNNDIEQLSQVEQPKKRGCLKKIGIGFLVFCFLGALADKCGNNGSKTVDEANAPQEIEQAENEEAEETKEQEKSVSTVEETNPNAKFVGTYRFDYNDGETAMMVVTEDGRCVMKEQGHAKFLGKVTPISNNVFKLQTDSEPWTFMMDVKFYNQGQFGGYTASSDWRINDIVFDLSEGRLYRKKSEYDNRDIARAEYTIMTHDSATKSKTSTCKTCGKEYIPDNEAIVSNEYCYGDYPQTCGTCGKTYTINTDGKSACKGTCSDCSSRHTSVSIYESVTGRKVH